MGRELWAVSYVSMGVVRFNLTGCRVTWGGKPRNHDPRLSSQEDNNRNRYQVPDATGLLPRVSVRLLEEPTATNSSTVSLPRLEVLEPRRAIRTRDFARKCCRDLIVMATSLPSRSTNRSSLSMENPERRPRMRAETLGWSTPRTVAACT